MQRGTFFLNSLKIDGANCLAYLKFRDKSKLAFEKYIGLPYASGTAKPHEFTGTISVKNIISGLLTKHESLGETGGLELSSTDFTLDDPGYNMTGLTITEKKVIFK